MRAKTLLVYLLLIVLLAGGCNSAPSNDATSQTPPPDPPAAEAVLPSAEAEADANTGEEAAETPSGTRVVTDMYGREVVIPAEINTVGAIGGAARIMTYVGAADMIIGVTEMDKMNVPGMPYSVVNAERFKDLPSIGSGGANDTTFVEELLALSPDVVIGMVSDQAVIEDVEAKTGIPAIGLVVDNMFDETFFTALELVGDVTGNREQSEKVLEYVKQCRDDLQNRTKDIPDSEKPTVYSGAVSFRGGHGIQGTSGQYPPFEAINANNVAKEAGTTGFVSIDLEQITVWDPEIIFLNPANMEMVNEDYNKNKGFFDNLSAVKNGKVYSQPPYNYNWSNIEIAIADTYYAGKIIFPEQFEDIDPVEKADEIFVMMLGEPFYEQLEAVGYGFNQIIIGEGN